MTGRSPASFVTLNLDRDGRPRGVYGPFATEHEAGAYGLAHCKHWTVWPLSDLSPSSAAVGSDPDPTASTNPDVVWQEQAWPHQWIGMHRAHPGGIRCNSRKDAEEFMQRLCEKQRCAWTRGGAS